MRAPDAPKTVVMVFGVFDILHPGHLAFLEEARSHGDELIVVVTPDEKAEKEKGRRPLQRTEDRIAMLNALMCVDRVIEGDRGDEWTVIMKERPDVICTGYDQHAEHPAFLAQIARLETPPKIQAIKAKNPEIHSSSRIRNGA